MEHLGQDLLILGVLFVIAYVFGRLGKLIGLPAIPIYMLVGLLASPNTQFFPLDFEPADVELVATFGLIFLLFSLGLEFDQDEFFGNARALLLSGGTRIAINMAVGLGFGFWVGWGGREALVIAGMTAVSSSAIITKLLIELRRLANRETPVILGIAVVEDIFIAVYLAIVTVVISPMTDLWSVVLKLAVSFLFLIVMFTIARWGGRVVSRLVGTRDDELFTILFFGLAVAFGGIGELIGVSDAIGAFLIGLVLGATRYRTRIEQFALPMRDVFGAFFFLNFGLALNVSEFGGVVVPVIVARRADPRREHAGRAAHRLAQPADARRGLQRERDAAEPRRVRADPRDARDRGRTRSPADPVRRTVRADHGDRRTDAGGQLGEGGSAHLPPASTATGGGSVRRGGGQPRP